MDDTDFDLLCEGASADEARRLRKILKVWCDGEEDSFPVQLALLTRAQWRAAAATPKLLNQSQALLERKLAEYRQQTITLLKGFNDVIGRKTVALEALINAHRATTHATLEELRNETRTAEAVLNQIQGDLTNGARELKKLRDDVTAEGTRLKEARHDYEFRRTTTDWVVLLILLLAMAVIGIAIGWRWH